VRVELSITHKRGRSSLLELRWHAVSVIFRSPNQKMVDVRSNQIDILGCAAHALGCRLASARHVAMRGLGSCLTRSNASLGNGPCMGLDQKASPGRQNGANTFVLGSLSISGVHIVGPTQLSPLHHGASWR
jgi:hypothetical protein